MFPSIAPADIISNSLSSSTPVANVAWSNFWPYGAMIAGVFMAVATLLIIIYLFQRAAGHIHNAAGHNQWDNYKPIIPQNNFMQRRYQAKNNSWVNNFNERMNKRFN